MQKKLKQFVRSPFFLLALCGFILCTALGSWLLNRGKAFGQTFYPEDYTVSDSAKVGEDVTIDEIMGGAGSFLKTPSLSLQKGVYQVVVNYNADREGSTMQVFCSDLSTLTLHSAPLTLDPASHSAVFSFELTKDTEEVAVEAFFSGSGYLSITGLSIHETSSLYKKNLFYALVLCLLLCLGRYFIRSKQETRQVIFALSAIFLISCYPLYLNYLLVGHDLPFHLLRIEGIKAGLSQGIFPVKIHPVWAKDYGYAVGVFYGDALLYFPAFLRLLGFSIQTAYQYFAAAVNLGTVLVSYFAFRRMFRSRKIGILGSGIYTLSMYRLVDMYTRAAVGEYSAMMFFPLVLCGFYLIFMETDKTNWWKHGILTALGLTGLVQTHVLSCEMAALFILLTCLVLIRKVLTKHIFLALSTGAICTLLLNLSFLVPFLHYYGWGNVRITSPEWAGNTNGSIQDNGLFPVQLFSLFQRNNGGSSTTYGGITGETTFTIGILLVLGSILFCYQLLCHKRECQKEKNFAPACLCFGLGLLAAFMSTYYFPWDSIASFHEITGNIVLNLQFPWRLLAIATPLLTFVCCFAFQKRPSLMKESQTMMISSLCLFLAAVSAGWYFYDFTYNRESEPYRVYDTYELNSMTLYSGEYLPAGTNLEEIETGQPFYEGVSSLEEYTKQGTKILCRVTAEENGGFIDFPLNYYPDYHAVTLETGESLTVIPGYNHMVRVELPAGYEGTLQVTFQPPWFWRLSEIISALAFIVAALIFFKPFPAKGLRRKAAK